MTAAKRVLQYLNYTANFGLHFNSIDIGNSVAGYSHSDRANDSTDRKSQGGHVFSPAMVEQSRGSLGSEA